MEGLAQADVVHHHAPSKPNDCLAYTGRDRACSCRKCGGGKLQPEADLCGSCGSAASTLSRLAPSASAPESDEKPTWLKTCLKIVAMVFSVLAILGLILVFIPSLFD